MPNPDPRLAAMRTTGGRLRAPGQVAIAPDGTLLAWTLAGRAGTALNLTVLANPSAKEKVVTVAGTSDCSNGAPVWSPDSKTLAFTSTCTSDKSDQPQIFLYSRATGESKQLTHLKGIFQQAAFSPDGSTLAFLFVENATRSAGALAAMKPWSGVIGEDGVEIQRVYAVNIASGQSALDDAPHRPPRLRVRIQPRSSHEIAYIGAASPPGENTWWIAKLYTRAHGGPLKTVFDPATSTTSMHGLQMAVPRFSPDGSKIAFIGGLMSDQGSTGGDVWVVDAQGGQPTDITPNIDGTPCFEAWLNDDTIGIVEDRRGRTLLPDVSVSKRAIAPNSTLGPRRDDHLRWSHQGCRHDLLHRSPARLHQIRP